jgi:hypothetical protein
VHPVRVVLIAAVAVLVGGGIAYATIPDSTGKIHACYKLSGGALRVIDSGGCLTSEAPLSWSQTGPQGQQGIQWPQGERGPSDLWHADGFTSSAKNLHTGNFVSLTSVTVPAGNYFVQASTSLDDPFNPASYGCDLTDAGGEFQFAVTSTPNTSQDTAQLTFNGLVSLTSSDTITLRCDSPDLGAEAASWELDALQVGTVHTA